MEADIKQQKVHNHETIQTLLYNKPNLIRNQVESDPTFFCMAPFFSPELTVVIGHSSSMCLIDKIFLQTLVTLCLACTYWPRGP